MNVLLKLNFIYTASKLEAIKYFRKIVTNKILKVSRAQKKEWCTRRKKHRIKYEPVQYKKAPRPPRKWQYSNPMIQKNPNASRGWYWCQCRRVLETGSGGRQTKKRQT
jgi:hypothetical protein